MSTGTYYVYLPSNNPTTIPEWHYGYYPPPAPPLPIQPRYTYNPTTQPYTPTAPTQPHAHGGIGTYIAQYPTHQNPCLCRSAPAQLALQNTHQKPHKKKKNKKKEKKEKEKKENEVHTTVRMSIPDSVTQQALCGCVTTVHVHEKIEYARWRVLGRRSGLAAVFGL